MLPSTEVPEGSTRSTATRSGWKPRFTSSTRAKLRISSPAVTSRMHASATSETTSARRTQAARALPLAPRACCFERVDGTRAGHLQRGDESEDHAGEERDANGEGERRAVDLDGLQQRQAEALEVRHGARREDGEQQAERRAAE